MVRKISSPSPSPTPGPRASAPKAARPAIPKAPARQAAPVIQRPAPARQAGPSIQRSAPRGGGGPSYGGPSYGGGGPISTMSVDSLSVDPPIPSEEDYLAGDSTYQATLSALARQLQSFQADLDTQRANRKLDYDRALKDLGYIGPGADGKAAWNWDDVLTASGRAYQNNANDFASRGMLQSQAYADSINNLQRSLMDQFTGIDQTNTQFNADLDRQLTKARDENTSAQQQARAEAIMRRAAQYGFGV